MACNVEVNLAILPTLPRFPQVCWPFLNLRTFFLEPNEQVSPWVKMAQSIQLKRAVYKWMATRFPCKSQGWVICHMLVEKAREKTQFGWFPVKKAVANTGSCGNCDLHIPRAKTIHILEDLTHKTEGQPPLPKKKVI